MTLDDYICTLFDNLDLMNKNTIIGTLLISILLMFMFSNNTSQAELEAEGIAIAEEQALVEEAKIQKIKAQGEVEKIALETNDSATLAKLAEASLVQFGDFSRNAIGTETPVSIENDLVKIEFSNKGAQVKRVELKAFKTWQKTPLYLIDNTQSLDFKFTTKDNKIIETKDLYYDVQKLDDKTVSFKLNISGNQYVEHKFSLVEGSYFTDFDLNFVNLDNILNTGDYKLSVDWKMTLLQQEKGLTQEKRKSSVYWKVKGEDDFDNLSMGASKDSELPALDWIAYKDQFFNVTLLVDGEVEKGTTSSINETDDTTRVADFASSLDFDQANNYNLQYFFGPNDYKLLKSFENGQENLVELSVSFFLFNWVKYINKGVVIPLFRLLEKTGFGYGIIIILLTLIIRMAMMPLTFKSYVSTAKTKLLKPELDALKLKYKDDQSKFAQEQMKLYQSTGVSMFGGCLPMLLQMPFFLAMFYFFPSAIELRGESFLWAADLSSYDVLFKLPMTLPILGNHISGFTLLMTVSSLVMARFNPQMQNQNLQPGMEMMKYMPYIFPIFLFVMFNTWAAGLTLYYAVSNVVTLSQQLFINKFMINEEKIMLQLEENKKKKPKEGGFRNKLSDAYKQQQKIQEEKNTKKK